MIKLLLHHILVQLDEPELKTASGIILSLDEKKERKAVEYGRVIQVGPTAFIDYGRTPDIINVGDRISLNRYSGKSVVDVDEQEYIIINDQDVLCVIE